MQGIVASFFEALNYPSQVAVHRTGHMDNAVYVVWHVLEGKDLDFGVVFRDVEPCLLYLLPQW